MSNDPVVGLRAALVRENNKLLRQNEAISATEGMIQLIEAQIEVLSKKK